MTGLAALQEVDLMGEGHEFRWGGVAGIGAVVSAILAFLIVGSPPTIMDSPGSIAAFLSDHRSQILTGALLYAVAIVLALWFGAALATAFRRADQTSDASTVVLAGYILVGAIGFIAISVVAGMTYAMTAHPDLLRLAVIPFTAITVVGTIAGIAVALPMGASAVAIARTHVFPMWMAWFAGLVALVRALASISVISTGSAFAPGSVLVSYLPAALAGLWVLTASGLLIREHLPVITARTAHPPWATPKARAVVASRIAASNNCFHDHDVAAARTATGARSRLTPGRARPEV